MSTDIVKDENLLNEVTKDYPQQLVGALNELLGSKEEASSNPQIVISSDPVGMEVLEMAVRDSIWKLTAALEEKGAVSFFQDQERTLFSSKLAEGIIGKIKKRSPRDNSTNRLGVDEIASLFRQSKNEAITHIMQQSAVYFPTMVASSNTLADRIEKRNSLQKRLEDLNQYEAVYSGLSERYQAYVRAKENLTYKEKQNAAERQSVSRKKQEREVSRTEKQEKEQELEACRSEIIEARKSIEQILASVDCTIHEYRRNTRSVSGLGAIDFQLAKMQGGYAYIADEVESRLRSGISYSSNQHHKYVADLEVLKSMRTGIDSAFEATRGIAQTFSAEVPDVSTQIDESKVKDAFEKVRELEARIKVLEKQHNTLSDSVDNIDYNIKNLDWSIRLAESSASTVEGYLLDRQQKLTAAQKGFEEQVADAKSRYVLISQVQLESRGHIAAELTALDAGIERELQMSTDEGYVFDSNDLINFRSLSDSVAIQDPQDDIIDNLIPQIHISKLNSLERKLGINRSTQPKLSDRLTHSHQSGLQSMRKDEVFRELRATAGSYFTFADSITETVNTILTNAHKVEAHKEAINELVKELKGNKSLNKAQISNHISKLSQLRVELQQFKQSMSTSIGEYKKLSANVLSVQSRLLAIRSRLSSLGVRRKTVQEYMLNVKQSHVQRNTRTGERRSRHNASQQSKI